MNELPRDLQLNIIKHFDIDTRIKCGIIGKLKICTAFLENLKIPQITRKLVKRSNPPLYTYESKIDVHPYILTYQGCRGTCSFDLWGVLHDNIPIYVNNCCRY